MCRLRKSTFTNLCAYVKVQAFMAHIQPSNNKPVLSRSVLTHGTTMKGYLLTNAPCFYVSCTSWGRWGDILAHGRFKRPLKEADVETICRALLAYCLLHYRGDENIKSFIWDLITPSADGTTKTLTNHSGNLYCVVMDVPYGYTVHKEYWIYKKKNRSLVSLVPLGPDVRVVTMLIPVLSQACPLQSLGEGKARRGRRQPSLYRVRELIGWSLVILTIYCKKIATRDI